MSVRLMTVYWLSVRSSCFAVSALQLIRDGAVVGTTLLPNLTLKMGNNSLAITSAFQVRCKVSSM